MSLVWGASAECLEKIVKGSWVYLGGFSTQHAQARLHNPKKLTFAVKSRASCGGRSRITLSFPNRISI